MNAGSGGFETAVLLDVINAQMIISIYYGYFENRK